MGRKTNSSFWKNKRVLITGHEGFLGSWLAKTLAEYGALVVGIDKIHNRSLSILNGSRQEIKCIKGDIVNAALVKKVINRYKPQFIFHIAAEAIVNRANKNPLRTFKTNIQGTWNILEAAKGKSFIEGIVVASSDKAYGSHEKLPYKEEAALKGEHPYDVSKSCTDLLCRSYFVTFGVPVCVTRCGNIYGPGDFNFSRLIPDAIRHVLRHKQFIIRSDGTFTRDYIFVKDVVDAYLLLAQSIEKRKLGGEAFNFSGEKPLSVLEVYRKIATNGNGGKSIKPKILNQAGHEIRHQYLSSRKAKKLLGWQAGYSFERGLKETLRWYEGKIV